MKRSNNDSNGPNKKSKQDDDPLSSILGDIDQSQHGKLQSTSIKSTFSLDSVMNRIIELSKQHGGIDSIEVEGRIGLFSNTSNGNTFKPGMVRDDWNDLYHHLKLKSEPVATTETDYIYSDSVRVAYDEHSKKCLRKDKKTDKTSFDQSTNLIYDFRISTSIEEKFPPPLSLPTGYIIRREKQRYTFTEDQWKIDLTKVIVRPDFNATVEQELYEVEIELFPEAIQACQEKTSLTELLNDFLNAIKGLTNIVKNGGETSFPEISLDKVGNVSEFYRLRDLVFKYIPSTPQRKNDTFPGSMPVNFGKKYFIHVQNNEYFVSDKTDGIRYMLLIDHTGCYLVDRKFDFYQIQGFDILVTLFGEGTLLDGEMVRNLQTKRANFLIFDVLSVKNELHHQKLLKDRLTEIGNVVSTLRSNLKVDTPFDILGKSFQLKSKIVNLFKNIKEYPNGERVYSDGKRCHNTDGIIFTPNIAYGNYTVHTLFKWKYCDKWTIDFKVRDRGQKGWYLSCVANDNIEVDCREVNFSNDDLQKLRREFQRARDTSTVVAECSFQPKWGTWKFHQVRHDKKKGNYISIVMDTMESIAENLSSDELKYRIPLLPHDDNWEEEMSRIRSQLINNIKPSKSSTSTYQPFPQ
ncbi:hypothetical protein ACTFIW_008006 [Dictyostelium discoideum]